MNIRPASMAYSILRGTRILRRMTKLNKHCSFHQGLLIDREIRAILK